MSTKTQNLAGTLTALSQEIGIKPLAKIVATGRFLPSVFLNSTNSTKILTKKITMPPSVYKLDESDGDPGSRLWRRVALEVSVPA